MSGQTSVFARALGSDVERLHPALRRRFGLVSDGENACVGRGVMDRLWRGPAVTVPFLWFGAWRHVLVPRTGRDVPFTIENYAYVDGLGRETVSFVRTFEFAAAGSTGAGSTGAGSTGAGRSRPSPRRGPRRSRFDATMVADPATGGVLDYLGSHQHLAVDLDLEVDARGGLVVRSGAQRFYEGRVGFAFPMSASGTAVLREHVDDAGLFHVDLAVTNRHIGPLFGYRGTFDCTVSTLPAEAVPASVKPLREESRG